MRKLSSSGRAETPVGLFTKAAEWGAFRDLSPCEVGVFRAVLAKANAGGRAETCRDSVAAQVGCTVRTVSRALSVLTRRGLLRRVKTLTGFVTLIDVSRLRELARCVDLVKAKARDMLLSIKETRAHFAQVIENLGKGHGDTSSGHGVSRSHAEQSLSKTSEAGEGSSIDDYLSLCASRAVKRW